MAARAAGDPALHVDVSGHGPALVLAHGFGGSARNWGSTARALQDRMTVVRYDARGHARSGAPDDPAAYTMDALVADMGRALAVAGAAEAVVGGLSLGAATALAFARLHPGGTRGLVLAAYPPGAGADGGIATRAAAFAGLIERDGVDAAGARFVWGDHSGLDPAAAAFVRRGFLEHPAHGLAHMLRGVVATLPPVERLAPALRALEVPALVVVGADDAPSRAPSAALAAALPRARLAVVDGAGHVVNLHRPAEFHAALLAWLTDERLLAG